MDDVALCVCGSGMHPDTWRRMQRLFAELLEMSKPSGSGGYWADFGPVTYALMAEFSGDHIDGTPRHE